MKTLLLVLSIFLLAGCGTLNKMNDNLEQSTAMLEKNTATVDHSSEVISANTEEIARSNSQIMYFPIAILIILGVLFYPSYRILKEHRMLQHDIRKLLQKRK